MGCAILALLVRSLGLEVVFPADGVVRLTLSDADFHARLALYAFTNFPEPLTFDRFMAWPDGAVVPAPPGFDWTVAAVARLLGDSVYTLESVLAWFSPVVAALTTLPVFAIGSRLAGAGVGVGAAALFAVLPASTVMSSIGDGDHHATVALLGACWVVSSMSQCERRSPAGRSLGVLIHATLVAALLLTWSGSLLYLAFGEGARLVAWVATRRSPRLLVDQCVALVLTAGVVAPWVASAPVPPGGPLATTTLSWLHIGALGCVAACCAALVGIEAWLPSSGPLERGIRAVGIGLGILGLALEFPGVRDGLGLGVDFLTAQDVWASRNPEQFPLFSSEVFPAFGPTATGRFGLFALFVPVTPLLVALGCRKATDPAPLWIAATWLIGLVPLTLDQVRYASDLAPLACVVFALATAALARAVVRRARLRDAASPVLAVGLGVVLIAPALTLYGPRIALTLRHLMGTAIPSRALSPRESLMRFGEEIRRTTPETPGYLDRNEKPQYGVLVPASLGHSFGYAMRRPVPANNLGPYLDAEKYRAVDRFYGLESEAEALATLDALRIRYVVTPEAEGTPARSLHRRLHREDGSATEDSGHWQHFRLITEGPRRGRPVRLMVQTRARRGGVVYKLFERVPGALLEVSGAPGSLVRAELPLVTPLGRRFRFVARARVESDGFARLCVPYPSTTTGTVPTHAESPWEVSVGDEEPILVTVSERAVREALTVVVSSGG